MQYGGERPAAALQHGHVTPPPSYLGPGEGDSQQQQQQQYFSPLPGQPAAYPYSCHHSASDVQDMCGKGHSSKAGLQDSWRQGGDRSVLQHSHVTPPPSYLGQGEGDGQQQQQQQYFHPHPPNRPVGSMPLLLPPFCMSYSEHVWRRALQLSWCTRQREARWRQVCTAAQQHKQQQQLVSPLRTVESHQTTREEG